MPVVLLTNLDCLQGLPKMGNGFLASATLVAPALLHALLFKILNEVITWIQAILPLDSFFEEANDFTLTELCLHVIFKRAPGKKDYY